MTPSVYTFQVGIGIPASTSTPLAILALFFATDDGEHSANHEHKVILQGGAQAENIFWQVATAMSRLV
jgi:hypothetical protein